MLDGEGLSGSEENMFVTQLPINLRVFPEADLILSIEQIAKTKHAQSKQQRCVLCPDRCICGFDRNLCQALAPVFFGAL